MTKAKKAVCASSHKVRSAPRFIASGRANPVGGSFSLCSALSKLARAGVFALVLVLINQSHSALSAAVSDNLPPFTAKGTVLTEASRLNAGRTNIIMSTENEVFFSYSNGLWRIDLECKSGSIPMPASAHMDASQKQLAGILVDCMNISDGIRYVITHRIATHTNVLRMAFLEPTKFPPPENNDLFLCWLALCPNPALPLIDGSTMRRLITVDFLKDPKNQGEYALQYLAPDNVFLSELCITNEGITPMHDATLMKRSAPHDQGHLEFAYKVLETTNWHGLVFPLRSVLHKYIPVAGATNRDDLFPSVTACLNIDSIQAGAESPWIDLTKLMLIAMDNRLPHLPGQTPTRYAVTNDQWPAATNPALVKLAAAYKARYPHDSAEMTAKKRHMVVMILVALTLAPLGIFIRYRTTAKINNNKTV